MKLTDTFFRLQDSSTIDGSYVCKVKLNASHPIYSVHFPDNPVTPGVCLIQIVTELLEQKYSKKLTLCKAKSIKFKRIVEPDKSPRFVFSKLDLTDGLLSVNVSIEDDGEQAAVMAMQFRAQSE